MKDLVAGSALAFLLSASSLVAVAQPAGPAHRIGRLRHFAGPGQFALKDQRQTLGEPGYVGDPVASGQPTTLDLVINGRTAKTLGLALPQLILLRAADVVE